MSILVKLLLIWAHFPNILKILPRLVLNSIVVAKELALPSPGMLCLKSHHMVKIYTAIITKAMIYPVPSHNMYRFAKSDKKYRTIM